MEEIDDDLTFETQITKIIFHFALKLGDSTISEGPQNILPRIVHFDLARIIAECCQNEKNIKSKIKYLTVALKNSLKLDYLVYLQKDMEPSKVIQVLNNWVANFTNFRKYINAFFRICDLPTTQRYLFLEGPSTQIVDDLFSDVLVQPNLNIFIESLRIFLLSTELNDLNSRKAFSFFVESIFRFGKRKNSDSVIAILQEIVKVTFECRINHELRLISPENSDFLKKMALIKKSVFNFVNFHFKSDELFLDLRAQMLQILFSKSAILILDFLHDSDFKIMKELILSEQFEFELTCLWEIMQEPDEILRDFRSFFLDFVIHVSILKIRTSQLTGNTPDAFLDFLEKIRNVVVTHFNNNKSIRFTKNKALEELMNERNYPEWKLNYPEFLASLFFLLKSFVSSSELIDSKIGSCCEVLAYINPKIFRDNMSLFLIKWILDGNTSLICQTQRQSVFALLGNKLGEDCLSPAIHVFKELKCFEINQNENVQICVTLIPNVDNFDHINLKIPLFLKSTVENIKNLFIEETTKGLKQIEIDFDNGSMQIEFQVSNDFYTLISTPFMCLVFIFIFENNEVALEEVYADLFDNNEHELIRIKRMGKLAQLIQSLLEEKLIFEENGFLVFNNQFAKTEKLIIIQEIAGKIGHEIVEKEESFGRNAEMESKIMKFIKLEGDIDLLKLYGELRKVIFGFNAEVFRIAIEYLLKNEYIAIKDSEKMVFAIL